MKVISAAYSNPVVRRLVLTFFAGGALALLKAPELAEYAPYLIGLAGVLLGKAHLSKPGEGPRVPPAG